MAFDFPTSPSIGATYSVGTKTYVWDGEKWLRKAGLPPSNKTALRRNRMVNGALQISQEFGDVAQSVTGSNPSLSIADQFVVGINAPNTIVVTATHVAKPTPKGNVYRLRFAVATAKASLAAADYLFLQQQLEGTNLADLLWNTALTPVPVVLRFGVNGPAGTYCCGMRTSGSTHNYAANFTITPAQALTDIEVTIPIPAPLVGTWSRDNSLFGQVFWTFAAGSNWNIGVDKTWSANSAIATPQCSNGVATVGNTFEVFDIGFHPDPDNTGVAPQWEPSDLQTELVKCWRYFQRFDSSTAAFKQFAMGYQGSASAAYFPMYLKTTMRANPTASFSGATTYHPSATAVAMDVAGIDLVRIVLTVAGTANLPVNLQANNTPSAFMHFSARM
jgi:hypothetical protein